MAVGGELEQAVMEILWSRRDSLSVRDVHDIVSADRELAYTTVMTVLDRLAKKGIVRRRLAGRAWLYEPAKSRAEETTAEVLELLGRLDAADRAAVLAAVTAAR